MRKTKQNLHKQYVKEVSQIFKYNANKNWGLTNKIVNKYAKFFCSKKYKGVFMPENVMQIPITNQSFSIIANVGKHFVAIIVRKKYILYIDSYGKPCKQPSFQKFLKALQKPIFYNDKQIQSVTSMYCGLYAVLFCIYYDKSTRKTRLIFKKNPGKVNDKLCLQYIRKLIQIPTSK